MQIYKFFLIMLAVACPQGMSVWAQSLTNMRAPTNPDSPVCPVSNCPMKPADNGPSGTYAGGPVLAAQDIQGRTLKNNTVAEWESTIGLYVSTGAPNGQKVAQYVGAMQAPGGGSTWSLNTDVVRGATAGGPFSVGNFPGSGVPEKIPGSIGRKNSTIGYELDLSNFDEDSEPGTAFVVGEYINTLSKYTSLSAIFISHQERQKIPSWHWGVNIADGTVKDVAFRDESGANIGFQSLGKHNNASFQDESESKTSIQINGHYYISDINDKGNSPSGLNVSGNHTLSSINTQDDKTDNSITIREGQRICFNGYDACIYYKKGSLTYKNGGKTLFEIDDKGNATFMGRIKQMGKS